MLADAGCVAVLDSGAAANSVCFRWLEDRNKSLGRTGRSSSHGLSGLRAIRFAADIPVRLAGNCVECTAFVPGADFPAFLRKGALEAAGG